MQKPMILQYDFIQVIAFCVGYYSIFWFASLLFFSAR